MDAVRISTSHFSGQSNIFDRGPNGLAAILRGLAMDNARIAVLTLNPGNFTDNSTGTARAKMVAAVDVSYLDASASAVGAPTAAPDTAIASAFAAMVAVAQKLNVVRTRLGLPVIDLTSTTPPATPGTIPAVTKTVSGAQGTACAVGRSVQAQVAALFSNLDLLNAAVGSTLATLGFARIPSDLHTGYTGLILRAPGATVASADGRDAASAASVGVALTALADGVATLAGTFNAAMSAEAQAVTPLHVVAA